MRATQLKRYAFGVAVVLALGFMASPAGAAPVLVTATDWNDASIQDNLGTLVDPPGGVTSNMVGCADVSCSSQSIHAYLTGSAYQNGGTYTYKLVLDSLVNEVKRFSGVAEGLGGFSPATMKAGWSFSQAGSPPIIGGFGDARDFDILWDPDVRSLSWELSFDHIISHLLGAPDGFWGPGQMTFFFQATVAPTFATYSMVNEFGAASVNVAPVNVAPVPEPSSLLLLLSSGGLASVSLLWRRRRENNVSENVS